MTTKKKTKADAEIERLINEYLYRGQGKELLSKGFTLESVGLWRVHGQDQSRGEPFDSPRITDFGFYEGALGDVLREVVDHRDWNGWTEWGGRIVPVEIKRPKIKKV